MKDEEAETDIKNGSIPIGDLNKMEDALNNSYWKEILLEYAKSKKIDSYILLMDKIISFRKLESETEIEEESNKIYESILKLEFQEDQKEVEEIKQKIENRKEISIQTTLFDQFYQRIHERIQKEHWNEFNQFSTNEDEKIHLKDAVEMINLIGIKKKGNKTKINFHFLLFHFFCCWIIQKIF